MEKELLQQIIDASMLTQTEISKITGVPQASISRWLNNVRTPRLSKLNEMAEMLNIKIDITVKNV